MRGKFHHCFTAMVLKNVFKIQI